MNFQTILEELDILYESAQGAKKPETEVDKDLHSLEESGSEVTDDAVEIEADDVATDEPRQLVLECAKCSAIVLKDEADVNVDEETDLANIDEKCQYCEEAEGYKIIGEVAPYATVEDDEEIEIVEDDEEIEIVEDDDEL